jgi:hypothetical protein
MRNALKIVKLYCPYILKKHFLHCCSENLVIRSTFSQKQWSTFFFRRRHFAEKEESDLNIFLSLQALIFAGEVIENPECDISDGAVSSQNVLLTFRVFKLDLDIKMHFS